MPRYSLPPYDAETGSAGRWLRTALWAVVGAALLVLGFFFALIALAATAVLVTAVALRWWWITRKLRRAAASTETVVEGEYRVVEKVSEPEERKQDRS